MSQFTQMAGLVTEMFTSLSSMVRNPSRTTG